MTLKDYQQAAMERFEEWHRLLELKKREAEDAREELINSLGEKRAGEILGQLDSQDYAAQAWQQVSDRPHVGRLSGAGEHVPNVCFRVPTGGGKTLLAGCALERMGKQAGLVLWIVPSRAIFDQTMKSLNDKGSMLRQSLDRASSNRVAVIGKEHPLNRAAVDQSLCIMLLMKQGADNRREDFLRIRRDSAMYSSFFPPEDDEPSNHRLLAKSGLEEVPGTKVPKHSLLNVIRILRPVVVLDEAHKTRGISGDRMISYVNDMNPSVVLELTATPREGSNILVDVTGKDLRQEEMIKMPINLTVMSGNSSWKGLLQAAMDDFGRINAEADEHPGRYLRPIMVVRTERTGRLQKDKGYIHAEHVREYIEGAKSNDHGIAVKTAEQDDLRGVDLMSNTSSIRYIITKDALREGWDCPFAYMLVILDKIKSSTAVTQLLGRILRQPGQKATGNQALDSCYVYCRSEETSKLIKYVKDGLEADGLSDVTGSIVVNKRAHTLPHEVHEVEMRSQFKPVYLPRVLHRDRNGWIELDYDRHILSKLDWDAISAPDVSDVPFEKSLIQSTSVDIDGAIPREVEANTYVDNTFMISEMAQVVSETMPNQWQAARIAIECVSNLKKLGHDNDAIYGMKRFLTSRINDHVSTEIMAQAEAIFRGKLQGGQIRFDLEVDSANYRMRERYAVSGDRLTILKDRRGRPVQRSLFDPSYEEQFDTDVERSFAAHLEAADALKWWHRIAAKDKGEYYLRGWQRRRIWPDFVALFGGNGKKRTLRIYEIKGHHLDNPDTEYKNKVLGALQGAFDEWGVMKVSDGPMKGEFKILFENRVDEEGARLLNASKADQAG